MQASTSVVCVRKNYEPKQDGVTRCSMAILQGSVWVLSQQSISRAYTDLPCCGLTQQPAATPVQFLHKLHQQNLNQHHESAFLIGTS